MGLLNRLFEKQGKERQSDKPVPTVKTGTGGSANLVGDKQAPQNAPKNRLIEPEYQEYALEKANTALIELKKRKIRGAKVLKIGS